MGRSPPEGNERRFLDFSSFMRSDSSEATDAKQQTMDKRKQLVTDPLSAAFDAARAAGEAGEVPVGAAIARGGHVIACAANRTMRDRDPTAHAEMLVIRAACVALGTERLVDCDLYVTLEPCAMCAGAISFARIRRLYFSASDPKGGAVEHGARFFAQPTCHHAPEVYGGMRESEAAQLLRRFFQARR
jgi:tRNA(adenine34) deaminase